MAQWHSDFRSSLGLAPKTYSAPEQSTAQRFYGGPGSSSTQYKERTFPEAVNVDQLIPKRFEEGEQDSGTANALETAMSMPAYGLGRPIAAASQAIGMPEGESILDPISEGLRSLPVIGQPLDSLGKKAEDMFDYTYNEGNFVAAPLNAHLAWLWDSTKDNKEEEGIGLFAELNALLHGQANPFEILNPFDNVSKEELRERYNDFGWSDAELAQIDSGEKGFGDFARKRLTMFPGGPDWLNGAADFGMRAAGDPLNLFFGAGLISKAMKALKAPAALGKVNAAAKAERAVGIAGEAGPALRTQPALSSATAAALRGAPVVGNVTKVNRTGSGLRAAAKSRFMGPQVSRTYGARVRHAAQVATKMTATKALPASEQAAALANGSVKGVTLSGFSADMARAATRGRKIGGTWGRRYVKAAAATTGVQVGLNLGEEFDIAPNIMGDWYDAAAKMGERKPLSENDLFVLTSLMHFPARSYASTIWDNTAKRGAQAVRKNDSTNHLLRLLEPDAFITDKAGRYINGGREEAWRRAVSKMAGGEESLKAAIQQVFKTAVKENKLANGGAILPDVFPVETLAEAGYATSRYNRLLNNMMRRAFDTGAIKKADITHALESITQGRGGLLDEGGKALGNMNASTDDFYRTWNEWEPFAKKYSQVTERGSAIAPGITNDLVIEEDMMWAINELKVMANGSDTVTAQQLLEVLRVNPAVFKMPGAEALQKARVLEGKSATFKVDDVEDILTKVAEEHGVTRQDFFAHAAEWENLAGGFELARTRATNANAAGEKVDLGANRGTVVFDTPGDVAKASAMAGLEGRVVENARAMRAQPSVIQAMTNIPTGLRMAGFKVLSAVDGIALTATKGVTIGVPSIAMRFDVARPFKDIVEAAAIALEKSAGKRATVVLRGDTNILAKGLKPNGTEHVYDISRKSDREINDLVDWLQGFGDRVQVDQVNKTVEIIVPTGKKSLERKLAQAEKRMGAPASEPVHFRDIVKGKKANDIPNGRYSHELVLNDAKRNRRYYAANSYIERGAGGVGAKVTKAEQAVAERAAAAAGGASTDGARRPGTQRTRYESDTGGGVRARSTEYLVGKRNAKQTAALEERITAAGITDTPSSSGFTIREGDKVFAKSPDGSLPSAGVVVRANGEFIPWRLHPNRAAPANFEDTLAEAADWATWARSVESDLESGVTHFDKLADHGFFPFARGRVAGADDAPDIIYMLRDPDHVASVYVSKNGYVKSVKGSEDIITMSPEQARVNTEAVASTLYPERAARARQAVRDATLINKERRLEQLYNDIRRMENTLASPKQSSKYRQAFKEAEELNASLSTHAAVKRRRQIIDSVVPEGKVRFVAGAEEDVARFKPNLDESVGGRLDELSDVEKAKVYAIERELREGGTIVTADGRVVNGTQYQGKVVPRGGTPYVYGQNEAYDTLMRGKEAADTWFRTNVTNRASAGLDMLFQPVYAGRQAVAFRAGMYNELIGAGASEKEADAFMNALRAEWEDSWALAGAKINRSPGTMGVGVINKIARGQRASNSLFSGFNAEVVANIGDFGAMVHRSNSRTYRNIAKKFPAESGKGSLGGLLQQAYGKNAGGVSGVMTAGVRRGAWALGTGYNILRFVADPRWYLMNLFEADFLGMARYGVKVRGVFGGKARGGILDSMTGKSAGVPKNAAVERLAGRRPDSSLLSVEEILAQDRGASGWVDPRALYGYVAEAVKATKRGVTEDFLTQIYKEGSPVLDDLKKRFGDDPQAMVDEIDDLLFRIDNKGAQRAIMEDMNARELLDANNPAYDEFLTRLWQQHEHNYKDIVHTFHGNVNRNNLERLINSPLLWWPASYQIKTGKWLIDVMTKGFAGGKAELAGSAMLTKLLANHKSAMEDNEEYRSAFENHPALFQAMSMMLPMTPFDMGAYMARWTRYSGSWIGAQLGLTEQDETYPQDIRSFVGRSLSLGPIYSADVLGDIWSEFDKKSTKSSDTPSVVGEY